MFETFNIAHVTPRVHFRRNQSVNLRNTVSEFQKNPFFNGVVLETSNIAHDTPRVHTFLGKKKNFSNRLGTFFYLDTHTNIHTSINTNIQSPTNTNIVIDDKNKTNLHLRGIQ